MKHVLIVASLIGVVTLAALGFALVDLTGGASGSANASSCDTAALIEEAKVNLLKTTKSGTWYGGHLGTLGYWTDGWNLLAQAKSCAAPTTTAPTTTAPTTTTTPQASSVVDDLGAFAPGTIGGSLTNKDKYAAFITGDGLSFFTGLPGKLLRYTKFTHVYSDPYPVLDMDARAKGWLVHNSAGNEIHDPGYSYLIAANIGDVNYQNAAKASVLNYLAAHPSLRGIFVDGVQPNWNLNQAAYPIYSQGWNGSSGGTLLWNKDSDYRAAQLSLMSNIFTAVKNAGYEVYVNAAVVLPSVSDIGTESNNDNAVNATNWMDLYYPYVTGTMIEDWNQNANTHIPGKLQQAPNFSYYNHWQQWCDFQIHARSKGIGFWPLDYSQPSETTYVKYLRASFLMDWDGTAKSSWLTSPWVSGDVWSSALALDPGQPLSGKVSLNGGAGFKRQYEHYLIYVNPSQATQVLDGRSVAPGDSLWIAT